MAVVAKGKKALPKIKEWLNSSDEQLVICSCVIIRKFPRSIWNEFTFTLESILHGLPSSKTNAAAAALIDPEWNMGQGIRIGDGND